MSDERDAELAALPAYPASQREYELWQRWALAQYELKRAPTLLEEALDGLDVELRARHLVSWRALLGHWAKGRSVSPDDAPLSAHHFLAFADTASPAATRAARLLTRASLLEGATSADVLFLCAAFAWPLRDVDPELSVQCWHYLIHAPWQTDPLILKDTLMAAERHLALGDGRELMTLVHARLRAGKRASARRWLEAVALLQARRDHIDQITSYRDFAPVPVIAQAHEALILLARLYEEDGEDQVYAREIMKRAAELTRSMALVEVIEQRVWDLPLDEAYQWSEQVGHPRQLDDAIARALEQRQPHHARRLAEAVIIRKFNRLWYGAAAENLPSALEKFSRQLKGGQHGDPVGRRAAEHLAVLYTRTWYITQPARQFVHDVAGAIGFTGRGAQLEAVRGELELFFNHSDPYHLMRAQSAQLTRAQSAMSADEHEANDEVERWFSAHHRGDPTATLDRLARLIQAPLREVAALGRALPGVEGAIASALQTMVEYGPQLTGDLTPIAQHAARLRAQHGYGMRLMRYAEEVTRPAALGAASLAGLSSFLPPGLSLAAMGMDLGATLLLAARAIARVAVIYGRDLFAPGGLSFAFDALTVGLSSDQDEGMVAYMARPHEEALNSLTLGGVAYGTSRLVERLWLSSGATPAGLSQQAIRHTARVVGLSLGDRAVARVVPVVGALIAGVSTYAFMRAISDAAIHIAAREALLRRVMAYEQGV